MGGTFGLELARDGAPLKGVVSSFGIADQASSRGGEGEAKILVNTVADDPMVPIDAVKAFEEEMMKRARTGRSSRIADQAQLHQSRRGDGGHAAGAGIQQANDQRSWKAMVNFFEEIFRVASSSYKRRKTWPTRWPSLTKSDR